jgi:hypothetical protein
MLPENDMTDYEKTITSTLPEEIKTVINRVRKLGISSVVGGMEENASEGLSQCPFLNSHLKGLKYLPQWNGQTEEFM